MKFDWLKGIKSNITALEQYAKTEPGLFDKLISEAMLEQIELDTADLCIEVERELERRQGRPRLTVVGGRDV